MNENDVLKEDINVIKILSSSIISTNLCALIYENEKLNTDR